MINANENPLGPCPEAKEAVHIVVKGGRYRYSESDKLQQILAEQEGLKLDYVKIHPGSSRSPASSSARLHLAHQPLIIADPGYEAGRARREFHRFPGCSRTADFKDYSHDVKAMVAASSDGGLIYICQSEQSDRHTDEAVRYRVVGCE